jgi:hypothetical protein
MDLKARRRKRNEMLPGWKPSHWTLLGYKGPGRVYVQETPLPDAIGYQAWVPEASTWSRCSEWHSEGEVYNTFEEAAAAAMKWIESRK